MARRRRRLNFWQWFAVLTVRPLLILLTRRDWRGAGHIPAEGGVIIVSNHIAHADPLVIGHFVYDAGRWPQFLAKQSVFDVPVLGWILRRLRQIPVRRGTADAGQALVAAEAAVRAGDAVIIYPEGTTTKDPQRWPMRGKTGVARLWLATGAPVVPVVSWGPQAIYDPLTSKLRLRFGTPVTVVAGPPVDLERFRGAPVTSATLHEITEVIMDHLTRMLAEIRQETPPARLTEPAEEGR